MEGGRQKQKIDELRSNQGERDKFKIYVYPKANTRIRTTNWRQSFWTCDPALSPGLWKQQTKEPVKMKILSKTYPQFRLSEFPQIKLNKCEFTKNDWQTQKEIS